MSRFIAEYFVQKGDEVYVLNRNRHPQPERTKLIEADRHHLGTILRQQSFDAVLDVTAYTREDVSDLLDGMGNLQERFRDYVLISSGAVYPETLPRPFSKHSRQGKINAGVHMASTRWQRSRSFKKGYLMRISCVLPTFMDQ